MNYGFSYIFSHVTIFGMSWNSSKTARGKYFNLCSKHIFTTWVMVQQGTACRYPALLAKYSFCYLLCQNETKVAAGYRHAVRQYIPDEQFPELLLPELLEVGNVFVVPFYQPVNHQI